MKIVALLLTFIVGLFIYLGSLCSIYYRNNKRFTDFSISVAFGVIITLILFEILPESYQILNNQVGIIRSILAIIILILIGIIMLKILDLFVPNHEIKHNNINGIYHNKNLYHIGIIFAIAVIIHNLIEGMNLYLVSSSNFTSGLLFCIGVVIYNISMGLVITSTLCSYNYSKKGVLKVSMIISLSNFIGGIIMFVLGVENELVKGILLSLSLGMFIYISIFELFPQIYYMKNKKNSIISISIGIILLFISIFIR